MSNTKYPGATQAPEATKSSILKVNPDGIPDELKKYRQWVLYDADKIPLNAITGRRASSTDPKTWTHFQQALDALSRFDNAAGIGFVLTDNDSLACIDLDNVLNEHGEIINDLARAIVERFDSYTEVSPSGRGLHVWVSAAVIGAGLKVPPVEIYRTGRYMTVTGRVYRNRPIGERAQLLTALAGQLAASRPAAAAPVDLSAVSRPSDQTLDDALAMLQTTRHWPQIASLANGRTEYIPGGDKSPSVIDQTFCNYVQIYVKDANLLEQIWRATPFAQSPERITKMNRDDYVKLTVTKAFDRELPAIQTNWTFNVATDNVIPFTPPAGHAAFAAPAGAAVPVTLPLVDAGDFDGRPIPTRKWHVADLMPHRALTLLTGDGGVGKSLLAMQLAAATVTGTPWAGKQVAEGRCLYLSAEDDIDELQIRLADIVRETNTPLSAFRKKLGLTAIEDDAILAAPHKGTNILQPTGVMLGLQARLDQVRPRLLVLDTQADLYGGNDNDKLQVKQFINMLRKLARSYDMAILILSHPSLSGMGDGSGRFGSVGWNNFVRSRWYFDIVDKEDPDGRRVLATKKNNYGPRDFRMHWLYRNGLFVPDGRTGIEAVAQAATPTSVESYHETAFLKLLFAYTKQSRKVTSTSGKNYAPAQFAGDTSAAGITKEAFKNAMNRLLHREVILNVEHGPTSRRVTRLVLNPDANLSGVLI